MRPYGSDRLRVKGDRIILFCPIPKNWVARVPRTSTSVEHPGTAVMWDGEYFEVVEALAVGNAIRYELEKWRDEYVIRVSDVYDEPSEAKRAVENRKFVSRTRKRRLVNVSAVFSGFLPAAVQNELASELGVLPNRLTVMSGIFTLAAATAFAFITVGAKLAPARETIPGEVVDLPAGGTTVPLWPIAIAVVLVFETIIRFFFVLSQNRPIGSVPGFIAYTIYWAFSKRRKEMVSPFEAPHGERLFMMPPTEEVAVSDKVQVWSAFLTLLTPDEQRRLMTTVGFDYRVNAVKVALFILAFSAIGAVSSVRQLNVEPRVSAVVALLVAAGLGAEQLLRLAALREGPAGSVLGVFVRPFVKGLLARR